VSLQIFDLPLKYLGHILFSLLVFFVYVIRIYNLRQFIFVVFNALVFQWKPAVSVGDRKKQEVFAIDVDDDDGRSVENKTLIRMDFGEGKKCGGPLAK